MAPTQPNPLNTEYETSRWQQITGNPDIANNALNIFVKDEQLLDKLTPEALNERLVHYVWNGSNPRDDITINELWNMLTSNVYLAARPRNKVGDPLG